MQKVKEPRRSPFAAHYSTCTANHFAVIAAATSTAMFVAQTQRGRLLLNESTIEIF